MNKDNTSLALFYSKRHLADAISANELLELLETMKRELILFGNSPLLSAAFQCYLYYFIQEKFLYTTFKYSPQTYVLTKNHNFSMKDMSAHDAIMFIYYLSEHIQGKKLDLTSWQKYFSKNMVLSGGFPAEALQEYLEKIDSAVFRARYAAFSQYTDEPSGGMKKAGSDISEASKRESDELLSKARRKADGIIAAAKSEADRLKAEAERILANAQTIMAQADAARASAEDARAQAEAARAKSEAKAVQAQAPGPSAVQPETAEPERPAEPPSRQELIEDGLAELRRALMNTNAQMRKLEDSILESGRDETIRQFLDLYNLIADSRDSALELAGKPRSPDPQNVAQNLSEFLNMIAGFMTSYGVTVHTGAPGDPFSAKTQEVRNSPAQYDPRTAKISASLRSGFLLDDVVLQKEWVWLKESGR